MGENKFFVNQKKKNSAGAWDNNVHVKDTLEDAQHQFHAFMSTYGYGYGAGVVYASCSITDLYGSVIRPDEVWMQPEEEPEEE